MVALLFHPEFVNGVYSILMSWNGIELENLWPLFWFRDDESKLHDFMFIDKSRACLV